MIPSLPGSGENKASQQSFFLCFLRCCIGFVCERLHFLIWRPFVLGYLFFTHRKKIGPTCDLCEFEGFGLCLPIQVQLWTRAARSDVAFEEFCLFFENRSLLLGHLQGLALLPFNESNFSKERIQRVCLPFVAVGLVIGNSRSGGPLFCFYFNFSLPLASDYLNTLRPGTSSRQGYLENKCQNRLIWWKLCFYHVLLAFLWWWWRNIKKIRL